MRTPRIFGFFLLALGVVACGGNKKTHKDLHEPSRGGAALEPISFRFADNKPSLDSDGTKLVFVSGRDSSDQEAKSKAYKTTWPAGKEPGEVTRVTTDDTVGIERGAWISPDGLWVLVLSANGVRTDLWLQDFAGAKPPVQITNDDALESSVAFSPDGKLIAWISSDKVKKTNLVKLVEIGDASAATLAKQTVVTKDDKTARQVLWAPAGSGYRLAFGLSTAGQASADYSQRSFTDFAGAASAADVAWFANFVPDLAVAPVYGGSSVLFAHRLLATDNLIFGRIGTDPSTADAPHVTPVASEPAWIDAAPESPFNRYFAVPGTKTLGIGKSADGATNFFLEQFYYRCAGQDFDTYGSAFVVSGATTDAARTKILPKLDSQLNFVPAADFCELKLDGAPAWVDDKISEMAMPTNATADKFRIVYTTRFSTKFDADCQLRAGDTEIMALDVTGDTKTFYPVSKNQAPLSDADRSGKPPCSL